MKLIFSISDVHLKIWIDFKLEEITFCSLEKKQEQFLNGIRYTHYAWKLGELANE